MATKMARVWNFCIHEEKGVYNLCSENKGTDYLCGYLLRILSALLFSFSHMQKAGFLMILACNR